MKITNENEKIIVREKCFFCGNNYQMSAGKYEGKFLQRYGVNACNECLEWNKDGWVGHNESKLSDYLKMNNIAFLERNKKGWFPVE